MLFDRMTATAARVAEPGFRLFFEIQNFFHPNPKSIIQVFVARQLYFLFKTLMLA
jgi:hypothetical protein